MATISSETHEGWLAIEVTGVLTSDEILAAIDHHYPINHTGGTIWNLLRANLAQVRLSDFREIAQRAAKRYTGSYRKTAYVGLNEVFSQACMCSAIAAMENEEIEYCAFQDLHEAQVWIVQPSAPRLMDSAYATTIVTREVRATGREIQHNRSKPSKTQ